jgi:uncharacterized protein (TIGR00369 family)
MSESQTGDGAWERSNDGTFVAALGEVFLRRRNGLIEVALQTDERHRNLSGIVHGGAIMTLLDRVMGINCRQAAQEPAFTATITVNFLRPVTTGSMIVATCNLRKVGRRALFAEAQATVGESVVATASATCVKPGRSPEPPP